MQTAVATSRLDAGYEFAITDADFEAFRELILQRSGISLAATKRSLLCGRLARRLRHLGFSTFTQYYQYVTRQDRNGSELRELINRITTNKTEFFRESHHFDFLTREVLGPLRDQAASGGPRRLRIWSAGCSTGEEPYSIAMTIAEALPLESWDIRILASDIDTEVLQHAAAGEYPASSIERVPAALRKRWFTSAATRSSQFRIHPELRKLVSFRQINLISEPWPIQSQFDVIFCRNVTIYFNREVQRRLYERFARLLRPDGLLVAGHSENLHWLSHLFTPQGSTVYRGVGTRSAANQTQKAPVVVNAPASPSAGPPPVAGAPASAEPDPDAEVSRLSISSGEWHASATPTRISTVLGSCIAVCLYDPVKQVGGMNHFMLPQATGEEGPLAARYGVHAMELLVNTLMELGADRLRLRAKVFGAAHVIPGMESGDAVARKNAHFVRAFLEREAIPVEAEFLGGNQALIVQFFTHTAKARVKPLSVVPQQLIERDRSGPWSVSACDPMLFCAEQGDWS